MQMDKIRDLNEYFTADPKRPYKLYAAMVSAGLTSLLTHDLPMWATAGITSVIAALSVYLVPNPIVGKKKPNPPQGRGSDGFGP